MKEKKQLIYLVCWTKELIFAKAAHANQDGNGLMA